MLQRKTKPKILSMAVLLIAGLLAMAHIGATLAFTGPSTPIKSSLQPELNKYFLGPLDQGWSLFAPGPYSQDEYFTMRACVSDGKTCAAGAKNGAEFTEWRDVTAEEMVSRAGNIFSNREAKQSKAIHGRLWGAVSDLSTEAKEEIEKPFVLGVPVFGMSLDSAEAAEKYSASERASLRAYKRMEDTAVGFATLYAQEQWGGASMIEIKLRRESVTPFALRHEEEHQNKVSEMYIGWRDAKEFDEQTLAVWK